MEPQLLSTALHELGTEVLCLDFAAFTHKVCLSDDKNNLRSLSIHRPAMMEKYFDSILLGTKQLQKLDLGGTY